MCTNIEYPLLTKTKNSCMALTIIPPGITDIINRIISGIGEEQHEI